MAAIQVWQGIKHPETIGKVWPWIAVVSLFVLAAILQFLSVLLKRKVNKSNSTGNTNDKSEATGFVQPRIIVSSPGISFRVTSDRKKVILDVLFFSNVAIELTHLKVAASINRQEICTFLQSEPAQFIKMGQHRKMVEAVVTPQELIKISLGSVVSLCGTATFRYRGELRYEPINIVTVAYIEPFAQVSVAEHRKEPEAAIS